MSEYKPTHPLLQRLLTQEVDDDDDDENYGWYEILDMEQAETLIAHLLIRGAISDKARIADKHILTPDGKVVMINPAQGEPLTNHVWSMCTHLVDKFLVGIDDAA